MALPFQPKGSLTAEQLAATRAAAKEPAWIAQRRQWEAERAAIRAQRTADEAQRVAQQARRVADGLPYQPSDAEVAAVQAEAQVRARLLHPEDFKEERDRAGRERSIADALPNQAQAAGGMRVNHLRVLMTDLPKRIDRETDAKAFYARIEAAAPLRQKRDPLLKTLLAAARAIVKAERFDRTGFIKRSFKGLAKLVDLCAKSIQRSVRFFEKHNLMGTLNTIYRDEDGLLLRGPNVYVPAVDVAPAPLPADVKGEDPKPSGAVSGALGTGARLAALFRLALRPWGLNATPLRSDRDRQSTRKVRPAPA
jgi:hypothetical protein